MRCTRWQHDVITKNVQTFRTWTTPAGVQVVGDGTFLELGNCVCGSTLSIPAAHEPTAPVCLSCGGNAETCGHAVPGVCNTAIVPCDSCGDVDCISSECGS